MITKRVILIVLDGVGVGELPDAADFGDLGSNSLANTAKAVGGLNLPNMQRMGLGNLADIIGVPPTQNTIGAYGKLAEMSKGKDSTLGHWELAGIYSPRPLPMFPNGFPLELVAEFEQQIGRKTIGNRAASGTEIINELGGEHVRTGQLILYTSADSVFQLAAHEDIIPIDELYRICKIARQILTGEYAVGRVIARPFTGKPGQYLRTERRKDFSLPPPEQTILDNLSNAGYDVISVGKIDELFANQGITKSVHVGPKKGSNLECIKLIKDFLKTDFRGLLFANLIEFDTLYGHRNDPYGYASALEEFDFQLPDIITSMDNNDILMITSDHGNDPVAPSTDHSREYVPLLLSGQNVNASINLGARETFADVAASIANLFGVSRPKIGHSLIDIAFKS